MLYEPPPQNTFTSGSLASKPIQTKRAPNTITKTTFLVCWASLVAYKDM